jgi:GT2 family glycosyltransferase
MTLNEFEDAGILAIVLTFNAPDGAAACLSAIQGQTRAPDAILVVDNHSDVPVDQEELARLGSIRVEVQRTAENNGPAGGYAAGLERFRGLGYRYAWVMDDDVEPAADALGRLVDEIQRRGDRAVVGPVTRDLNTGESWEGWGWWAVLIPRAAVELAGVPDVRLFWGLEDQEYLRDRLPLAGFPLVRCDSAIVPITVRPAARALVPWKRYYLARNVTYRYLYGRSHVPALVRLKSLAAYLREQVGVIWARGRGRPTQYLYLARGVFDGVCGRLGKRVSPGSGDRPWARRD